MKKCRSFNWLTRENELIIDQNKRFKNEKVKFEEDIYKKVLTPHLHKIVYFLSQVCTSVLVKVLIESSVQFVAVLNTKKSKLTELKKEVNKWMKQSKAKSTVKEEDERDDTTSSSSEDEDDESGHEKSSPEKKIKVYPKLCNRLLSRIRIIS